MDPRNYIDRLSIAALAPEDPEGLSILAVTTDERLAIAVGPLVAHELHPTRRFGRVLHHEPCEGGFEVVVEDLGPRVRRNPSGNGVLIG